MAEETWRLFIAVPVPNEVRDSLEAAIVPLRQRIRARWQSPGTWHLTLRFLGDTPVAAVAGVEAAVRASAGAAGPFDLELGDAGAFERQRGGDIAWVGIGRGAEQLAAIEVALRRRLAPAEVPREPFRAHLTIAREAPRELLPALRSALADARREPAAGGGTGRIGPVGLGAPPVAARTGAFSWRADRLVLYRSVLGRGGATHTELVAAPLG